MTQSEVLNFYPCPDNKSVSVGPEILSGISLEKEEQLKKGDGVRLTNLFSFGITIEENKKIFFEMVKKCVRLYGIKHIRCDLNWGTEEVLGFLNQYLQAFPDDDVTFYINLDFFVNKFKNKEQGINFILNMTSHPKIKVVTNKINAVSATRISKEDRKKLSNVINTSFDFAPKVMPTVDFLDCIDKIVDFINQNAENDYQKVLLLSEIIRKNFKYDPIFRINDNSPNELHYESHCAESLLTRGVAVCNGISTFAKIILNHPSINIGTVELSSDKHAWNGIEIDGKWYMCDFTAVVGGLSPYSGLRIYYYKNKVNKYMIQKTEHPFIKKMFEASINLTKPKLSVFTEKPILDENVKYSDYFEFDENITFSELPPEVVYEHFLKIKNVDVNLSDILGLTTTQKKGYGR